MNHMANDGEDDDTINFAKCPRFTENRALIVDLHRIGFSSVTEPEHSQKGSNRYSLVSRDLGVS